MCEFFKGAGEIAGLERIDGEKWRSRGEEEGRPRDWMGLGWGRVTRESDAFSRCVGASGSGLDEVVRPGCTLGRPVDIG